MVSEFAFIVIGLLTLLIIKIWDWFRAPPAQPTPKATEGEELNFLIESLALARSNDLTFKARKQAAEKRRIEEKEEEEEQRRLDDDRRFQEDEDDIRNTCMDWH